MSLDGRPRPEQHRDLIGARRPWRDPSQHIRPFSAAPRVEADGHSERSLGREDDRRRNTGHRGCGDLGCGHAPRDFHVAVAVDHLGRRLGEASLPTTAKGYERLLCWAEAFGPVRCAGVEGTSSYGAGLARYLRARSVEVLEVERPKHRRRSSRSNLRKSDPSDAEAAARAVLAGEPRACPRAPTVPWR